MLSNSLSRLSAGLCTFHHLSGNWMDSSEGMQFVWPQTTTQCSPVIWNSWVTVECRLISMPPMGNAVAGMGANIPGEQSPAPAVTNASEHKMYSVSWDTSLLWIWTYGTTDWWTGELVKLVCKFTDIRSNQSSWMMMNMFAVERVQFQVYFQVKCHCFAISGQIVRWEYFSGC